MKVNLVERNVSSNKNISLRIPSTIRSYRILDDITKATDAIWKPHSQVHPCIDFIFTYEDGTMYFIQTTVNKTHTISSKGMKLFDEASKILTRKGYNAKKVHLFWVVPSEINSEIMHMRRKIWKNPDFRILECTTVSEDRDIRKKLNEYVVSVELGDEIKKINNNNSNDNN